MKAIICFDLDGTLVNEQGKIHAHDIELLNRHDLPIQIIAATGRSLESVRATFHKNGLFLNQAIPFPLILLNGAFTCLPGETPSTYIPFENSIQKQLIALAGEYKQISYLFLAAAEVNMLYPNPFGIAGADKYEFRLSPYDFETGQNRFCKVMCLSDRPENLAEIAAAVKDLPVSTAYSMSTIFEISPPGVNKGSSLLALLKEMGLQDVPLYTAGDGENDLELLKLARLSFAPQTALPVVKQAANQIIDSAQSGLLTPLLDAAGVKI